MVMLRSDWDNYPAQNSLLLVTYNFDGGEGTYYQMAGHVGHPTAYRSEVLRVTTLPLFDPKLQVR